MIDLTGDDDDALTSAPARSAAGALTSAPAPGPARSAAPSTNETDAPSSTLKRKAPAAGVEIVVGGDLLNAEEPYVAHQGNCESRGARGLAKVLFAKWPAANVYKDRRGHSTPGSVEPRDVEGKVVVALFAQRSPGLPRRDGDDSAAARLGWFEEALDCLGSLMAARGASAVAMPFNVGCGLAGGEWPAYRAKLDAFAARYAVSVKLYDRERASLGGGGPSGASRATRECVDCSRPLSAQEPAWKVRCYGCWKANTRKK